MFRAVLVLSWFLPVVAAAEPIQWHVEIVVTDMVSATTKEDTQKYNAHDTHDEDEHTESRVQISSDDLGQPEELLEGGAKGYTIDVKHPAGSVSGSYTSTDQNKTTHNLGGSWINNSERTSRQQGKVDSAEYSFHYASDKEWSFSESSSVTGTSESHWCDTEVSPHPDHKCNDAKDVLTGSGAGIVLGTSLGDQPVGTLTHKNGGFVIDFSKDENHDDPATGRKETHHIEAHITLSRKIEPAKYEAKFVPDKTWKTYIPQGPKLPASTGDGNSVSFSVQLIDRKTKKPSAMRFSTHYVLDSSKLRGTCMNWPPNDEKVAEAPDFAFVDALNSGLTPSDNGQSLELPLGSGARKVTVTSRDFGGFTKVVAHIHTDDGVDLDATWKEGVGSLSIPKDDNLDHIADEWENKMKAPSTLLDDEADGEYGSRGDGYTLFAEYRGFVEAIPDGDIIIHMSNTGPKPRFMRLSPARQDVFVGLSVTDKKDDAAIVYSVKKFFAITGFAPHYIYRRTMTAPLNDDFSPSFARGAELGRDGHADLFGEHPAYVIWVATDTPANAGGAPAFARTVHPIPKMPDKAPDRDFGIFFSQQDVSDVNVSRANSVDMVLTNADNMDPDVPYMVNGKQVEGPRFRAVLSTEVTRDDLRKAVKYAREHKEELGEKVMRFLLMHELGHAIGAYHHGDKAGMEWEGSRECPMWYWHFNGVTLYPFLKGDWDPSERTLSRKPYAFCNENRQQMHLHPKD